MSTSPTTSIDHSGGGGWVVVVGATVVVVLGGAVEAVDAGRISAGPSEVAEAAAGGGLGGRERVLSAGALP